jgi:hypothetical protein
MGRPRTRWCLEETENNLVLPLLLLLLLLLSSSNRADFHSDNVLELFVFARYSVRISAGISAILTSAICGFP